MAKFLNFIILSRISPDLSRLLDLPKPATTIATKKSLSLSLFFLLIVLY